MRIHSWSANWHIAFPIFGVFHSCEGNFAFTPQKKIGLRAQRKSMQSMCGGGVSPGRKHGFLLVANTGRLESKLYRCLSKLPISVSVSGALGNKTGKNLFQGIGWPLGVWNFLAFFSPKTDSLFKRTWNPPENVKS